MSFYATGLASGCDWFPSHEALEPVRNAYGEVVAGVHLIRAGAPRVYQLGTASQKHPLVRGGLGVLSLVEDLAFGLLVLAGVLVLGAALGSL